MLFEQVCDLPVRCARFIARKNWVVTGSDDMQVSSNLAILYIFEPILIFLICFDISS